MHLNDSTALFWLAGRRSKFQRPEAEHHECRATPCLGRASPILCIAKRGKRSLTYPFFDTAATRRIRAVQSNSEGREFVATAFQSNALKTLYRQALKK